MCDSLAMFLWIQVIGTKPSQIKNASCEHVSWKILIRGGPLGKKCHSERERWVIPKRHPCAHAVGPRLPGWGKMVSSVHVLHMCAHVPEIAGDSSSNDLWSHDLS